MLTLHVEPRNGSWVVRPEGAPAPLSEHADAGTATLAAFACAQGTERTRVLVHDRYHRVHPAVPEWRAVSRKVPSAR